MLPARRKETTNQSINQSIKSEDMTPDLRSKIARWRDAESPILVQEFTEGVAASSVHSNGWLSWQHLTTWTIGLCKRLITLWRHLVSRHRLSIYIHAHFLP